VTCPRCGASPAPDARFCPACGTALDRDLTTSASATVTSPSLAGSRQLATPLRADHPKSPASGWLTSSDSISHGRFAPGALLDGRYRIIGLVGRGGMGEVYRADDLRLGQAVALKFLPGSVAGDPVRLAQFHNEVRTARQVSHPAICRVHDIGEADGHLFLSMELVDGEDLATSLRRIGRFPEDKATEIARQLCAGLAAAHQRGVLHRDLKPANVMLDGAGNVRIMDFGLATIGAAEDVRAGTPAYMAPEQLLGREVTQRSDIYALGLILYELYTGRRAFTAATLRDLVEQHQSGTMTPPHEVVSAIDPAVERAILRCLEPEPARRPASALAVAAALPGGDLLAAALAAGETPSPEMVAAAGEGTGLNRGAAIVMTAAVLLGLLAYQVMALRHSPLDQVRPEYSGEVLAQKARDAIRRIGYADRPTDEAYGFSWDRSVLVHERKDEASSARWQDVLKLRPSPLTFWYRRSDAAMTGVQFHHDLLTPGIVTPDDPAPIGSGMMQLTLDHQGLLTFFEAIPPQVVDKPPPSSSVDWTPLFELAGLDHARLQDAEPLWNSLAASDVRAAWTGTWPGTQRPLRVEASALRGRPVSFQLVGPWTEPARASSSSGDEALAIVIVFILALAILIAGIFLAARNQRGGRGDRVGAVRLGSVIGVLLWALWICQVHPTLSLGLLGMFLLALVTTVFYAVLFWALYLALEPFVRRYWPQTLVSWTTLLSGRVRDPIVGRDVLIGILLGVLIALIITVTQTFAQYPLWPGTEYLLGLRSTIGRVLMHVANAIRAGLLYLFLLFLLRVVLRNQWLAAAVFVAIFALLDTIGETPRVAILDGLTAAVYSTMFAIAIVRWGLTTLVVGLTTATLLLGAPATGDLSAWFVPEMIVIPLALAIVACWAFYRSIGRRLWQADPFA
jgi:serine/threonine-protein kinase